MTEYVPSFTGRHEQVGHTLPMSMSLPKMAATPE
jgi:hypothetical protein